MDMTLLSITNLWPPFSPASIVPPADALVVVGSACVVTSDSPTLTQHHVLVVDGSECAVTSTEVTLSIPGALDMPLVVFQQQYMLSM